MSGDHAGAGCPKGYKQHELRSGITRKFVYSQVTEVAICASTLACKSKSTRAHTNKVPNCLCNCLKSFISWVEISTLGFHTKKNSS